MVSASEVPDKFARTGMTAVKSEKVDAPIIEEFPVTLECRVKEIGQAVSGFRVVGEIVGTLVDESVLDEEGNVDVARVGAFVYDEFKSEYHAIGEKVGTAWNTGNKFCE